jgi:hypothetical protein
LDFGRSDPEIDVWMTFGWFGIMSTECSGIQFCDWIWDNLSYWLPYSLDCSCKAYWRTGVSDRHCIIAAPCHCDKHKRLPFDASHKAAIWSTDLVSSFMMYLVVLSGYPFDWAAWEYEVPNVTVSLIQSWNYRNRLIFVAEGWYASSKDRHFVCETIQWLFGNLASAKATIWTDLLAMHLFNITTYLNHLTKPQATNSRQLAMRNRDKQSILQAKIALSDGPGFPESSPISLGWFT